jgi:hypothetical protein
MNKWNWDYEEGADPSYYHIYSDDGTELTFDIEQSEFASSIVKAICDLVNGLKLVEDTNKALKKSREIRNDLG